MVDAYQVLNLTLQKISFKQKQIIYKTTFIKIHQFRAITLLIMNSLKASVESNISLGQSASDQKWLGLSFLQNISFTLREK
ncbi:hypothetical protein FGO68_gene8399 [Halteria grandinella]|uniref:Uncharacterized protein n=1 Tax=Halteria grandinella TaxID=5974 RepID=A0A8J8NZ95_HALGN|nr:hypothetical protein FGO68_gene8399 [Halteria grandinella]